MTDAVVIGAGHDGLAAAVRLAKAGRRVTLLERRPVVGGQAALEEFCPGYSVPGIQHHTFGLRPRVVRELGLADHGLELRSSAPLSLAPERDGPDGGIALRVADDDLPEGLYRRSRDDVSSWTAWRRLVADLRPLVGELVDRAPPAIRAGGSTALRDLFGPALGLRRLGSERMVEVLRTAPMCAWDHLTERFGDPLLKAFLASRAIEGGFLGPWSAGSAALLLLRECAFGPGVRGGPSALTDALFAAARAHEVTVVTDAEVTAIRVEGGGVAGVETAGGLALDATEVVSTVGVARTLLRLVPQGALPVRVRAAAGELRRRGSTAAVRLALSAPLRWRGRDPDAEPAVLARTAPTMAALERAFDCVKHRRPCPEPWLDVAVPSLERPELAPDGHASVSVLVHCAAAELDGGWTDPRAEELGAGVVRALSEVTEGLADSIVGREVLTPTALGERYALDGAHPMHAELDLAQLWVLRPSVRFARYETPLPGLFLAGRATHPGAELAGTSGLLAAEVAASRPPR